VFFLFRGEFFLNSVTESFARSIDVGILGNLGPDVEYVKILAAGYGT